MFLIIINHATSLGGVFWSEKVLGGRRVARLKVKRGGFQGYGVVPKGIAEFRKLSEGVFYLCNPLYFPLPLS